MNRARTARLGLGRVEVRVVIGLAPGRALVPRRYGISLRVAARISGTLTPASGPVYEMEQGCYRMKALYEFYCSMS